MLNWLIDAAPQRLKRVVRQTLPMAAKAWHYARASSAESGLSPLRHLREELQLYRRSGLGPWAYYHYHLFDPAMPMEQKASYLTDDLYDGGRATARFQWRLTPQYYRPLYNNKLIADRFFSALGFPLAQVYGVYDPDFGRTRDGLPLRTTADLKRWLEDFSGDGFVFKPVEGAFGYQVLVLVRGGQSGFVTLAGEPHDAERLESFARQGVRLPKRSQRDIRSYLLQERLHPHPAVRDLVGGPTVCSVRIVTFIALDGEPRLLAAAFKLQPGLAGADNLSTGSVACFVDLDTGVLGRGRKLKELGDITVVPGTTRSFVGFRLPHWDEARAMALKAAAAFPWARAVAWDIALADRGAVLLEGNDRWAPALIQLPAPQGLMAGEFKTLCEALDDRA